MAGKLSNLLGLQQHNFKEAVQSGDCVHVTIDVQRLYCDPNYSNPETGEIRGTKHTDDVAQRIAVVSTQLREFMPTIIVYFAQKPNEGLAHAGGGLHHLKETKSDILCAKTTNSAMNSGTFQQELKKLNPGLVIVSGFNASACVLDTTLHLRKNDYDVSVIKDCIGADCGYQDRAIPRSLNIMRYRQVKVVSSNQIPNTPAFN